MQYLIQHMSLDAYTYSFRTLYILILISNVIIKMAYTVSLRKANLQINVNQNQLRA